MSTSYSIFKLKFGAFVRISFNPYASRYSGANSFVFE